MPISWNEIRNRAYAFVREWKDESDERAEAKSFWDDFFNVFGVSRRRVATFESRVHKDAGTDGLIDLLWKGTLLVEHKSRGKDLDRAHSQAVDYFPGLDDAELPQYIIVCDFARFRVYDMDDGGAAIAEFKIEELPDRLETFSFIAGYQKTQVLPENPVNVRAAEKMATLHDRLKDAGYTGRDLEILLVRLLFCLFGEDTGVFERNLFRDLLINHTKEDGSDLGLVLAQLFETLDTPGDLRQKTLPQCFADFAYINGRLFQERIGMASFDADMRNTLLDATRLHWADISPAIFGSLFQGVMDAQLRRNLGAHYTVESNILKVVRGLFLDDLREEFKKCGSSRKKLTAFHDKIASLRFLDPACGCGNFLIITYRELRLLEIDVLLALNRGTQLELDVQHMIKVNVDQFYGIELEEFPAQIAQVALWLTDHQMNLRVSEAFGLYFARLPLTTAPTVVHANALTTPWSDVVPSTEVDYILGNPPFVGSKYQSQNQRAELDAVASGLKNAGILDYVTCWYILAARFIQNTDIEVAFVSTNSITQGEQVGVLWPELLGKYRLVINFAHRTFQWTSQARGKAAVHCVIIGFGLCSRAEKLLHHYDTPRSEPKAVKAKSINPYLVDGPLIALPNRRQPLCHDVPVIGIGNKPIDGGHYLFAPEEKADFVLREPQSAEYFRRWIGAEEFLNGQERWCLWLGDCPPAILRSMPECLKRVAAVRDYRLASKSEPTRKLAQTPTRFHVENMPNGDYLVLPGVSSERREYIPIGFMSATVIASNLVNITGAASKYHFGLLTSRMHMTWMRYVAGRLKSDYRYSIGIVYNNFPWPQDVQKNQYDAVAAAAQDVLNARAKYPAATLADLYDPLSMPSDLHTAHNKLDRIVDRCYRPQPFTTDESRIQFLFDLYERIAAPTVAPIKKPRQRKT